MEYKKRNRSDSGVNPKSSAGSMAETELVLKLKKDELFDQHILLPHAELNSVVYTCVNTFVEKYRGEEMTLAICTDSVNPAIQNVFREVYRAHYEDELQKVKRYLKRRFIRMLALIAVCISSFVLSNYIVSTHPDENIFSYLAGNISVFCLWEVGYTQFATHDVVEEKKRITRALNAKINFV